MAELRGHPASELVIPSVIADEEERRLLRSAVPGAKFAVCELTAPEAVLKDRVTAREPNEFWQGLLRDFVDLYHRRSDLPKIRDFQISTHGKSVDETAQEVIEQAGWQRRHEAMEKHRSQLPPPTTRRQ